MQKLPYASRWESFQWYADHFSLAISHLSKMAPFPRQWMWIIGGVAVTWPEQYPKLWKPISRILYAVLSLKL